MKKKGFCVLLTILLLFSTVTFTFSEPLPGGWAMTDDITISGEAQVVFDQAADAGEDTDLEAIGLLATQVVAGRNYCFLCRDKASGGYCFVYIYEDPKGIARIVDTQPVSPGISETIMPYSHDPRDNPDAMKDIVYNPDAVYAFAPDPASVRIGEYADAIDWTDPEQVADARKIREDYHASLSELYEIITDMLLEAKPVEEIARAVSQKRNELRLEAVKDSPENLELTKKSNLETYGHEEGPTPDELYEKYGSWQTVLEKALDTNAGMDACVGLYDEYYDYYDIGE